MSRFDPCGREDQILRPGRPGLAAWHCHAPTAAGGRAFVYRRFPEDVCCVTTQHTSRNTPAGPAQYGGSTGFFCGHILYAIVRFGIVDMTKSIEPESKGMDRQSLDSLGELQQAATEVVW